MMASVPLNEALKLVDVSTLTDAEAEMIWTTYLNEWQWWNIFRTAFSGAALMLVGVALRVAR